MNETELAVMAKRELDRISADVNKGMAVNKREVEELRARLLDVEQHQPHVRGGEGGGFEFGTGTQTLAALISDDEGFQMLASGRIRDTQITLPAGAAHGMRAAALTTTPGLVQPDCERWSGTALL